MKKVLSIFLALIIVLAVTQSALAATITTNGGTDQKDVEVKLVLKNIDPDTGLPVDPDFSDEDDPIYTYSVVVDWDNLQFTYTATGGWDAATHTYADGSWGAKTSANIKVTNHSNAPVDVSFAWDGEASLTSTVRGAKFTIGTDSFNLASAVGTTVADAPSNTTTVTVDTNSNGSAYSTVDFEKFNEIIVTVDSAI